MRSFTVKLRFSESLDFTIIFASRGGGFISRPSDSMTISITLLIAEDFELQGEFVRFIIFSQKKNPEIWYFVDLALIPKSKLLVIKAGVNIARLYGG
ncbi:MAG: hypothetical protein EZS28_033809 [Streblomastix strix]|uniref:Uncharacterized protein n=1 Tax=Streblomastix strix TaxID=222440 RepID=A0A5J4UKC2_9EUKA|nr:MAG: hypothetical protein EZS28_033809 [Streblomastix strix]